MVGNLFELVLPHWESPGFDYKKALRLYDERAGVLERGDVFPEAEGNLCDLPINMPEDVNADLRTLIKP